MTSYKFELKLTPLPNCHTKITVSTTRKPRKTTNATTLKICANSYIIHKNCSDRLTDILNAVLRSWRPWHNASTKKLWI